MKVSEVMSTDVQCTRPDATLHQAAERMRSLDVGSLPVCHQDRLVGMITDRDIVVRSVAEGHDPEVDHVGDVMSPEMFYCFEDQDVKEVAKLMKQKQVRRIPVMNRDKRLVGIVALGDLALSPGTDELAEEALEEISEPAGHGV
jgi:CBS domain-containing protein